MNPILLLLLAGAGAWFFFKPPGSTASAKPSEAPADADGILATALAPSLTDLGTLQQMYTYLQAAFKNATGDSAGRLALYALVVFLKACMLAKGAAPDANELAAIARAPLAGGAGLISYGDAGIDQMAAAATALAATTTDVGTIGTYISAIASVAVATATPAGTQPFGSPLAVPAIQKPRLRAYLLALKAKQMALRNAVGFPDAQGLAQYSPATFFAIANLPAANVPAQAANSILAYS